MQSGNAQSGFSYLLLLVGLSLMAILMLKSQDLIATNFRQQQEAINSYRGSDSLKQEASSVKKDNCFPISFEQLVFDNRSFKPRYHLRRIYLDPFTQKINWVQVFDSEGRWIGVHSSVKGNPLKKVGFKEENKTFKKANSYQEWVFKVDEDPSAPLPAQCKK
jgi:type II secretory pathway pseudopilin PulG